MEKKNVTKPKNIKGLKPETQKKRLNNMVKLTKEKSLNVEKLHVSVSPGNDKTGYLVPSVSLRPVLDCGNCKACKKLCYDIRNDVAYKSVQKSRANNAAIYRNDPVRYFEEINKACYLFVGFRWHVGGDIINAEYFENMVRIAVNNKQCKFLVFTKMFEIVNAYLDNGGLIPENLQVIFSGWPGLKMVNPYHLPESHPVLATGKTTADPKRPQKWCGGNCTECLIYGRGCWTLKKDEQILFAAH